jgi:cytochrome c peroxidase
MKTRVAAFAGIVVLVAISSGHGADKGAFKTPTLREVARRPPYMHDGSESTLAEVVAFYNRGGVKNPWLSTDVHPLGLTAQEQADLVEFLKALTGEIDPEVGRPPVLTN